MQVTVLVIIYLNKEYITIHDDDGLAWSELVKFIDSRWGQHFAGVEIPRPEDEEDRVAVFFHAEGNSYVMGNADVSELEAQIEAAFRQ